MILFSFHNHMFVSCYSQIECFFFSRFDQISYQRLIKNTYLRWFKNISNWFKERKYFNRLIFYLFLVLSKVSIFHDRRKTTLVLLSKRRSNSVSWTFLWTSEVLPAIHFVSSMVTSDKSIITNFFLTLTEVDDHIFSLFHYPANEFHILPSTSCW